MFLEDEAHTSIVSRRSTSRYDYVDIGGRPLHFKAWLTSPVSLYYVSSLTRLVIVACGHQCKV